MRSGRIAAALAAILLVRGSAAPQPLARPVEDPLQVPQTSAPPPAAAATAERVAGTVRSSTDGHLIAHAVVTLGPVRGGTATGETSARVFTDSEGRYRFGAMLSGRYHMTVSAPGFLSNAYQSHEGLSTAVVLGGGYPVGDLALTITPTARIRGTITDNHGDAVANAQVLLFRQRTPPEVITDPLMEDAPAAESPDTAQRPLRAGGASTDDLGQYEFTDLAPGTYFLAVSAHPWYATHARPEAETTNPLYRQSIDPALDIAFPLTFYPRATSEREARPLRVPPGAEISANIHLSPVRAVNLTINVPGDPFSDQTAVEGRPPRMQLPQLEQTAFGADVGNASGVERTPAGWLLSGLAPGEYRIRTRRADQRLSSTAKPVSLTAASTTLDDPPISSGAHLVVHLHTAPNASIPAYRSVTLRSLDDQGSVTARVSDNAADFRDVPAGRYRLEYALTGRAAASLRTSQLVQDGTVSSDRLLQISGSGEVTAEITVAYTVTLDAVVTRGGKPAGGAMALLVPADPSLKIPVRRDQSDMDGAVTFHNLPPGNYLALALDDAWQIRWSDPAVLAPYLPRAVPVVVRGGDLTQHLAEPLPTQPR